MRIMVKGGVWKNTEDEILKAAVMKYGKNQWARISSLLVRKSAKQCKVRWYEWLDPSIKKTEWSREEEEKLLHLAKIMPNQWKTIAPSVGRTASQCLEHYEKLLDAAQEKEENYDPADDPRRLRPGEIDPNPEAKPARPDPVDMDEDEKEMLSEARARLANTKGKKAKRKAREKQLEEARRLATLQKRRELKAAGIDLARPKKKIKGIDYNKEIPFQKKPAPGFFAVDWEAVTPKPGFKPISLEALEGKRRRDEEEEARKKDIKKQRTKEKKDLPTAIMQINKLNDPEAVTQRSKLMLPSPQLDEAALEELSKAEAEGFTSMEGGSEVTNSLLPSYNATPTPSRPLRTPLPSRTPSREDTIRKEAQNLLALTAQKTPLIGGQNPELHPSDFSGAAPKPQDIKTPNPLATPLRQGSTTPSRTGQTPLRTPIRDGLSINTETEIAFENQMQSRIQKDTRKKSLQEALRSLPAPQNEYKIMLPELPEEKEEKETETPDASDLLRQRQQMEQEQETRKLRMRSQVLQRGFPRPFDLNPAFTDELDRISDQSLIHADNLIKQEMLSLIAHEAITQPFKESRIKTAPEFAVFEEAELDAARTLLRSEMELLQKQIPLQEFEAALIGCNQEFIFVPSKKVFERASKCDGKTKLESLVQEFEILKQQMGREAGAASKLEQRLSVYNGGYYNRANTLLNQIQDLHFQIDQSLTELNSFSRLWENEKQFIPRRVAKLQSEVQEQEEREAELQKKYLNLKVEMENKQAASVTA